MSLREDNIEKLLEDLLIVKNTKEILRQVQINDPELEQDILNTQIDIAKKFLSPEIVESVSNFLNTPEGKAWYLIELDIRDRLHSALVSHVSIYQNQQALYLLSLQEDDSTPQ